MEHLRNEAVAVVSGTSRYPGRAPFHPPEHYPEHPHAEIEVDPSNGVYPMVRDAFRLLGMDSANFGSPRWNPLGEIISPGARVLIKPNFVLHFNAGHGPLEAVITHPSVLRAIADYVLIALGGKGEIVIGDAPQMNCDMSILKGATGMDGLVKFLEGACSRRGISMRFADFRQEQTFYKYGIVWDRKPVGNGHRRGVPVRLGRESLMEAIDARRLYGADYARRETARAHRGHSHEYLIAPEVLSSDVVISVPKLKVHRKVGTTLNLKNMVGINTDKNHLAHYRVGPPERGGDEFSAPRWDDRLERVLSDLLLGSSWRLGKYPFVGWKAFRKLWRRIAPPRVATAFTYGNWHGNDTAWRMVLDLNRILLFANHEGKLEDKPARSFFSVIDGVVGGEGEGPLHPAAYASGVVVAGFNPVMVDWAATRLMGFDPSRIPLYLNAVEQMRGWIPDFDIGRCELKSNVASWQDVLEGDEIVFKFRPAAGWRGTVERYRVAPEAQPEDSPLPGLISQ